MDGAYIELPYDVKAEFGRGRVSSNIKNHSLSEWLDGVVWSLNKWDPFSWLCGSKTHLAENGKHNLEEEIQQKNLNRQHNHIFHNASGHIVQVAFAEEHGTPQSAHQNVNENINGSFGQSDSYNGDTGPVQEKRVQEGTGHSGDGVAKEEAVLGRSQDEAQDVHHETGDNTHDRAVDGGAQSIQQVAEIDVHALSHRNVKVAQDQTQGDEQGRKGKHTDVFGISGCLFPVGSGKWGTVKG